VERGEEKKDPEPCLARILNSFSERFNPAAFAPATVNAANPEALDESPVPVGKLFSVTIFTLVLIFASFLILSICLSARLFTTGSIFPFTSIVSFLRSELNSTVVVVSKLLKFIEILPFSGSRNASFFFPQYLINAIFDGATAVAFIG